MRVLYISKALVVSAYRDKLRALSEHVEVRAVIPERWGRDPVEAVTPGTVPIKTWPVVLHGHNHLHLYRSAERAVDWARPDLVHIDEEPYSVAAFQFARLCGRRGIPSLFFAWQNLEKSLPHPFRAMRRTVFRSVAGGIAGTELAAEVLRNAGFTGPLAVIPQFGVDPKRFRPDPEARGRTRKRLGATEDDFVIGFAGRLVAEKGVHLLLEALRELNQARLVIVGDGPERARFHQQAQRLGVAERVWFVGGVQSFEMPEWLVGFDVLVLPSLRTRGWMEQFGRVLVEAMACGVPVVGSDSGEIPRVIGEAGRVFPQGDSQALSGVLAQLAASPAERRCLGERARARVLRLYTQEQIASATVGFYDTLHGDILRGARGTA